VAISASPLLETALLRQTAVTLTGNSPRAVPLAFSPATEPGLSGPPRSRASASAWSACIRHTACKSALSATPIRSSHSHRPI
jgi:hypothetical protein